MTAKYLKVGRPMSENPGWLDYVPAEQQETVRLARQKLREAITRGDHEGVKRYRTEVQTYAQPAYRQLYYAKRRATRALQRTVQGSA